VTETIITMKNGTLNVPDAPIIPFIEGDGIGRDIWKPAKKVIDAAVKTGFGNRRKILWREVLAGETAYQRTGERLPEETLAALKKYIVGIKGPLTTPVGGGIRSLNVTLRQKLDLFTCLRPVRWFKGVPSPVKEPMKVNFHIFRENTEDIYVGIEYMAGTPENTKFKNFLLNDMQENRVRFPDTSSFGVKPVSKEGSERLIKAAIDYALAHNLPSVTLVHKGNIMKFTEGSFKKWGYELAEMNFAEKVFTWNTYLKIKNEKDKTTADKALNSAIENGKLIIKDCIADAFLQDILLHPENHSVIATLNLNGDYISDLAAAMVGGIGMAPGANINFETGHAIFEATHGTAPDIVGTGKANPGSLILSGAMMLEYLGWQSAANLIYRALEKTIATKKVTADLFEHMDAASLVSTEDFAEEIIINMT